MSDLIKRIDRLCDWKFNCANPYTSKVLLDCRAEIERLTQSNQSLRDQNTALDEKLAEYSERTYTPMTDDEMTEVIAQWYEDDSNTHALTRHIEQAVIKKAGLQIISNNEVTHDS